MQKIVTSGLYAVRRRMAARLSLLDERLSGLGRRRNLGVVAVLVALALIAGGCSSENGDGALDSVVSEEVVDSSSTSSSTTTSSFSTTTTTTSTTVPVTEPEADPTDFPEPSDGEVFDEYIARQVESFVGVMRLAIQDPSLTPETDYPDLAKFAADPLLEVNYEVVRDFVRKEWVAREPTVSAVGRSPDEKNRLSPVMDVEGDTLTVFRCYVEDEDIINPETNELQIEGVVTVLTVVTMTRFEDGWKATESKVSQKIEGVAGCFLANDIDFPY